MTDAVRTIDLLVAHAEKRRAFADRVRVSLDSSGVGLVGLVLGRDTGQAVWILTVLLPNESILTLHAPVHASRNAFAPEAERSVVSRVVEYLRAKRLIAERPLPVFRDRLRDHM